MKYDFWRFITVFFLSSLIGIITGYFSICLIFGMLLFIWWQYKEYAKILAWLKKRKHSSSPSQIGIIDEICREIDYLRDRNKARKRKLSGFLKRFQESTSALPDAVIILGAQGKIEWANGKAQEYIGVQWPKDAGLRLSNLVRYPRLIEYLDSKKPESDKGLQITSPVNSKLMLEVRISTYGKKQQLLVARDITDISQTNKMRKDFIANASHELRTPLTVISGFLESFNDDENCPDEWIAYIQQMRSQTSHMQRLIEDLMQLSRLESKVKQREKTIIPVPDMLLAIVNEATALSEFMDHKITLDTNQDLYLKANQQEIYSVFSNLIFNAVQYTPEYGRIDIKWYEDNTGAHFSVSDNGPGITPEHIPRLTERFYRVDKSRSREKGGTGLGLAIVKHALARHDGNLSIESQLSKGSVFHCDFPGAFIVHAQTDIDNSLSA